MSSCRIFAKLLVLLLLAGGSAAASDIDGQWLADTDGLAMVISGSVMDVFEASTSFRLYTQSFQLDAGNGLYLSDGRRLQLSRDGQRLEFRLPDGSLYLGLHSATSLPPLIGATNSPDIVFDVFWEAFAENYALFELAGTDWQAMRDTWRPQALAAQSDTELFDIFKNMLAPLNDRHTSINRSNPSETYKPGPERDPFWYQQDNVFLNNIANAYLGQPLESRYSDPRLRFGVLPGNVGYLAILSFLDTTSGQSFADTLDAALAELGDTAGLVIDLRFNLGGTDVNSNAFLARVLSPGLQDMYARQTRLSAPLPAQFTPIEPLGIEALPNAVHRRPVAVLTSHNTASAADAVLLAMMHEPRFVQVGELTRGVFSKLLFRDLPNGWLVTLSNERYYSLEGRSYEQQGIPPAIGVDQADYDLDLGVDAGVDAALAAVAAQPPPVEHPLDIGLAASGLWYDPARDGEGWHIQRINDQAVFVSLYTFDPTAPDGQTWVVGLGRVEQGRIVVDRLFVTEGGEFGAASGGAPITERNWGRAVISFIDCDRAIAEVDGPDAYRGFVYRLRRLSAIPGLGCGAPAETGDGNAVLDGAWFVSARPGEGWLVSRSGADQAVVSWYTFDSNGEPLWLVGVGVADGAGDLQVRDLFEARGARYGYRFRTEDVRLESFGSLELQLSDCDSGQITWYEPTPDVVPLHFEVDRLSFLDGVQYPAECR